MLKSIMLYEVEAGGPVKALIHLEAHRGLSGGSGVHVWLVIWKAARSVEAYAGKSIGQLELCGSDMVLPTSGSMTVAVDRLAGKGLVERRAHGSDRRAKVVHLTEEERNLIARAFADHAADMERLVSASLTVEEREILIRLLKQIGYEAIGLAGAKQR